MNGSYMSVFFKKSGNYPIVSYRIVSHLPNNQF